MPAFIPAASAHHQMAQFSSYADLLNFVQAQPVICDQTIYPRPLTRAPTTGILTATSAAYTVGTPDVSTTNVQVQGVDELDTVKTDGQYIYTITNNTLVIVRAYPTAAAGVVAKIAPNGTLTGVFILGDKLVLIGGPQFNYYPMMGISTAPVGASISYRWYEPSTSLWVYDISNVASPSLAYSLLENGTYVGSRLIENSVYLITTQYVVAQNEKVNLPSRVVNGQPETTPVTQIYHSDVQDYYYSYTTVDRLDLSTSPSLDSQTFLISSSGTLYVSTGNIYLTSTIWACQEETVVHRVDVSRGSISYEATGSVPGRVMNQFSMD